MITLQPYSKSLEEQWDALVRSSQNGTFLFERNFMNYHQERFQDISLCFFKHSEIIALFPANLGKDSVIYSHQGLTYGGLIVKKEIKAIEVESCLHLLKLYYKTEIGAKAIQYKAIPTLYHHLPFETDLFFLYQNNYKLIGRNLSTALDLQQPLLLSSQRKRGIQKSQKNELTYRFSSTTQDWEKYWNLLTNVLQQQHQVNPVHSYQEITSLKHSFPANISLCVAQDKMGEIVAGVVLFISSQVIHAQYIASNEQGKKIGALDGLFHFLFTQKHSQRYFDFGISTTENGSTLNYGLLNQKEGFGKLSFCYDIYSLIL